MKTLKDLVEVVCNNDQCVVLKVKPNSKMDLICLGCFEGNEEMFRLTKGRSVTCTVFTQNNNFSWEWGYDGYTCVTDATKTKGRLIQSCIEDDFKIKCQQK